MKAGIPEIEVVLFDYGGVLADEGFKTAVPVIARRNGLDEKGFMKDAFSVVYGKGFTSGKIREAEFWSALREKTGIKGTDSELTHEILSRFTLRHWMIDVVKKLKERGLTVSILSDQTHWLDELNERDGFFGYFDHVFNSFHMGITKKEPEMFDKACARMGVSAGRVLFIDDHEANIRRAKDKGLHTVYYTDREAFLLEMAGYFPPKES